MRKLMTQDVFACCRCLKALGVKEKMKELAAEANSVRDVFDLGFDVLWDLFDAATESGGEAALYNFLAGPFEMSAEEVATMPLPDLFAALQLMAEENDLKGFFGFVRRLMKSS